MRSTTESREELSLARSFRTPRASLKERIAAGKALRGAVPREEHARFTESRQRPDPIEILERQAKSRMTSLIPVRYFRMLESPFAFLRGSAAVMASDLAATPASSLTVQTCGDMHVANFGLYASAERNLVFGINDFDETLPGPWEWDLKRLAASAVVAGRYIGASEGPCRDYALAAARAYREHMHSFARMGHLELWYDRIDETAILDTLSADARKRAQKILLKARRRTHLQVLDKLTDLIDDRHRIRDEAPLILHVDKTPDGRPLENALELFLEQYLASLPDDRKPLFHRYRIVDIAMKVVGVGSVGTQCWVVLMYGQDTDDPLFLQVKEALPSVLEPYAKPSEYRLHGQRVVVGQRMLQGSPDIFLGWGLIDGRHYYVRQLRDMKGGVEIGPETSSKKTFAEYCALCGWALALAHAKSGASGVLSGYLGNGDAMDRAVALFAVAYADRTERDHELLAAAAKSGRIQVAQAQP